MRNKWLALVSVLSIYLVCYQVIWGVNLPVVQSEGAMLIEVKTNTILYSKNGNKKFYPASITKLLTALICEEELAASTVIAKSAGAVKTVPRDSSHIGLQIGDSFSKEEALYGLLLGSDNFIAHDLATKQAGSIEAFSKRMNQKAKALGAVNTQFVNPHGYHDEKHYTTPYDMAQIAKGVFENATITKIAGTRNHKFRVGDESKMINIKNTSRLLDPTSPYCNAYVVATKTGWHDDAGQTLVAKAKYNDMELIAVTMKAKTPNQYKDVNALVEYGIKNFNIKKEEGKYVLQNNTCSEFGAPFVKYGEEQGWELPKGKNYQEPLNYTEFIDVLGYIWGRDKVKSALIDYTFENPSQDVTRKEAAYILQKVLKGLGIKTTEYYTNPYIPDISTLEARYQEAIAYTVGTKLLGAQGINFKPENTLSYEEVLCIAYRIHTTYEKIRS